MDGHSRARRHVRSSRPGLTAGSSSFRYGEPVWGSKGWYAADPCMTAAPAGGSELYDLTLPMACEGGLESEAVIAADLAVTVSTRCAMLR